MSHVRAILGIIAGFSAGYAVIALIPFFGLSWTDFGVALAITGLCWVWIGAIRMVERQKQLERDKSYHPSMWRGL